MKRINFTFFIVVAAILTGIMTCPMTVSAWGDNYVDPDTGEKGRPSYTVDQINKEGALGPTEESAGDNYRQEPNYPGKIVFNSISNSTIGDEKNFVGTRECAVLPDGRADSATKDTVWNGNNINVEDGKTYIVRLYVHNDNPNGSDAIAEDTRVSFSIPN